MSLYRLIDEESERQSVSRLCRTLGVTRSGYYDWQRQPLSDRRLADWLLTEQIRAIFAESEQTYGSPRVFKELTLGRGLRIGEKRVARLMRQAGLVAVSSRRRKGSTTRAKEHPLAPDLVQRDFCVDEPDRLWVADFTQLTTWQGTAYIAVVADAYSRLCLGWSVRADKTVELVLEALDMAIWRRGQMRASGAVHHSDQGSQYTSFAFTKRHFRGSLPPLVAVYRAWVRSSLPRPAPPGPNPVGGRRSGPRARLCGALGWNRVALRVTRPRARVRCERPPCRW